MLNVLSSVIVVHHLTDWSISISAFSGSLQKMWVYWFSSGSTGDSLELWKELDLECVEKDLRGVLSRGITCVAVLLLHSYTSVVSIPWGRQPHIYSNCIYSLFTSISSCFMLLSKGVFTSESLHVTFKFRRFLVIRQTQQSWNCVTALWLTYIPHLFFLQMVRSWESSGRPGSLSGLHSGVSVQRGHAHGAGRAPGLHCVCRRLPHPQDPPVLKRLHLRL